MSDDVLYTPPVGDRPISLFAKMAAIQGSLAPVTQDKTVSTGQYSFKYTTESQLLAAIRGPLADHKVAAFPSIVSQGHELVEVTNASGRTSMVERAWVTVQVTFADGDSGETFTVRGQGRGNDPQDKGLYKAITSALRYVWWKAMLVPTDDDDVNQSKHDHQYSAPRRQQAAPAPDAPPAASARQGGTAAPTTAQKKLRDNLLADLRRLDDQKDWDSTITNWLAEQFEGRGVEELTRTQYDSMLRKLEKTRDALNEQGVTASGFPPATPEETAAALEQAGIGASTDVEAPLSGDGAPAAEDLPPL